MCWHVCLDEPAWRWLKQLCECAPKAALEVAAAVDALELHGPALASDQILCDPDPDRSWIKIRFTCDAARGLITVLDGALNTEKAAMHDVIFIMEPPQEADQRRSTAKKLTSLVKLLRFSSRPTRPQRTTTKAVSFATRLLPPSQRARYQDEWESLLIEMPTRRMRIRQLVSLVIGAPRMAWVLRRPHPAHRHARSPQ